ncbi:MAG: hypothetical protein RMA76_16980 [Deltaproteobacteria bacterium]|jgi:hypothetical protein
MNVVALVFLIVSTGALIAAVSVAVWLQRLGGNRLLLAAPFGVLGLAALAALFLDPDVAFGVWATRPGLMLHASDAAIVWTLMLSLTGFGYLLRPRDVTVRTPAWSDRSDVTPSRM